MVSPTTISATEEALFERDFVLIGGAHPLANYNLAPQWRRGALLPDLQWADPDVSLATRPGRWAVDGLGFQYTTPTYAAGHIRYGLLFDTASTSNEFDIAVILGHNCLELQANLQAQDAASHLDVQLFAADTADFLTGETTVARWTSPTWTFTNAHLYRLDLPTASGLYHRFTNIRYLRLVFQISGGTATFGIAPRVGEVICTRRRQFTQNPFIPWDPLATRASVRDILTDSGRAYRYEEHGPALTLSPAWQLDPTDLATMELLSTDTDGFMKSVIWAYNGYTAPLVAWMRADPIRVAPYVEFAENEWSLELIEQRPFRSEFI